MEVDMEKLLEKFNNKKMIENLVIFLILAIIVMIVINTLFDGNKGNKSTGTNTIIPTSVGNSTKKDGYETDLEQKLESILSKINGAGKVSVMISYANEVLKTPMTDVKTTTTVVSEKDSNGGERKTEETSTEENVIYEQNGNDKTPMIKQSVLPEIVGVIVVASGATSISVKEDLIKAVTAAVDVPNHRIQVFAGASN